MKLTYKKHKVFLDKEDLLLFLSVDWSISSQGYLVNQKHGTFHRIIMNCPENKLVDHKDRNTLNNRKRNLRITNKSINAQNSRVRIGSSCPLRGVDKRGNSYRSYINFNKKRIYLGSSTDPYIAGTKYDLAAIYLYGEFAGLNFPERKEEYLKQLNPPE
jgi:hypothetical protein